jgi:hypothetical protein
VEPLLASNQTTSEYICQFCFSLESGDPLERGIREKVIISLINLIKSMIDVYADTEANATGF